MQVRCQIVMTGDILLTQVKRIHIFGFIPVFYQITVNGIAVTPHLGYALVWIKLKSGTQDKGVYGRLLTAPVIKENIPTVPFAVTAPGRYLIHNCRQAQATEHCRSHGDIILAGAIGHAHPGGGTAHRDAASVFPYYAMSYIREFGMQFIAHYLYCPVYAVALYICFRYSTDTVAVMH